MAIGNRRSVAVLNNSGSSSSGPAKPVFDVVAMAKDRQARSALPKVGGSGYGFAWDRKKIRAKTKEVKNEMLSGSAAVSATRESTAQRAQAFSPQLVAAEPAIASFSDAGSSTGASADSEASAATGSSSGSASKGLASTTEFDQFSYLTGKDKVTSDDPLSSFLDK
jgi:hypothetical protein